MSQVNGKYADPEVSPRVTRRRFSAEYKGRILEEADNCQHGELGALLRREGLYYSQLSTWRRQRDAGTLAGKRRGPKVNPDATKVKQLEKENAKLRRKLEQAEAIIAAQKKLARLLETLEGNEQP
jgi:transposase